MAINQKRLIDADKIVNGIALYMAENAYLNDTPLDVLKMVANWITDAPTVDAVEVVRCRDCKWYMPGDLFTDIMFCHRLKKDNGKQAKYAYCADDFCSYGERKDGDGNG